MDEFAETDLISIFSFALAVVDFDSYDPAFRMIGPPDTDLWRVEIKIWADKYILKEHYVKEVLRVAAQSLEFFSDFFDTTYNLGKMDLIILPDSDITVEDYYGLIYLG